MTADILKKTYDYVIVGGGAAGLCLAARLSEDESCSVVVLEAGEPNSNEQGILVVQYGVPLANPKYAWVYETVPQKHSNDKKYFWPRGKGLGGSSAVNFCCWTRPSAGDIDAYEQLGNPGWNWSCFLEYSKKSESFHPAGPEMIEEQRPVSNPDYHGTNGGIHNSYPPCWSFNVPILQTWNNLGIPTNKEPLGGDNLGCSMFANSYDPATWSRSYAATAFYTPNAGRKNLTVITSAYVHKLVTKKEGSGKVTATGVEFTHENTTLVINAAKEVILCAGALKSPQILELSGIGDRDVLEPLGIEVQAHVPGVGANVQEHVFVGVDYELQPGHDTLDPLRDIETAKQHFSLHGEKRGLFVHGLGAVLFASLDQISPKATDIISKQEAKINENAGNKYSPSLLEQYKIQLEHMKNRAVPDCEIIAFPQLLFFPHPPESGKNYVSMCGALNRPFSRGSIHVTSKDPKVEPAIDPHYFEENIDLEMLIETIKYIRKLPETEPFKSLVVKELNPGPEISDENLEDWVKSFLSTTFHTLGSLSMLPFEKGGVVDSTLKVYHTTNIRVADLSVAPLHVVSHTQTIAYAIAEQAADIIKGRIH